MSEDEQAEAPLHILVAQAIGWTEIQSPSLDDNPPIPYTTPPWFGRPPAGMRPTYADKAGTSLCAIPHYHELMDELVPLIVRFRIAVHPSYGERLVWGAVSQRGTLVHSEDWARAACGLLIRMRVGQELKEWMPA